MKRIFLAIALLIVAAPSWATDITWGDKTTGDTFFGAEATEVKTAVNSKADKTAALVGDCTVGPCLDGSSDGGNLIKLWAGTGSYWTALQGGAPAANRSWRLPIESPPSAGEQNVMYIDEYGAMKLLDKPGTTGYVLSSTDAGVLSWEAPESGGMVYPGAGIPNSTGSAWGTSYTLDTDLSTTSASDDTVPSAKAVKALYDALPALTWGTGLTDNSNTISVTFGSSAEINTGTEAGKAVTPDALAGSNLGSKELGWVVVDSDIATAVADSVQPIAVPSSFNGMNLVDVTCAVTDLNSAASGTTTVVIRRLRGATAVDMTSTGVTIDYNAYSASDETVDTSNDDVVPGDLIFADINAITTAAQKGLSCTAVFRLP